MVYDIAWHGMVGVQHCRGMACHGKGMACRGVALHGMAWKG